MAQQPLSTIVFNFLADTVSIIVFCLTCNPVSLWLINVVWPSKAASLVRDDVLFGETARAWYTRQALKWPFRWAKHWVTTEGLSQCTQEQQIQYFLHYRSGVETLKFMSQDAIEEMFCSYGYFKTSVSEQCQKREGNCTVSWLHTLTVAELIFRHCRLTQRMFFQAIQDEMYEELDAYVTHGALPAAQVRFLIDKVFKREDCSLFMVLMNYVKRYGLTEDQRQQIAEYGNRSFTRLLLEENTVYSQRKNVLQYYAMDTPRVSECWRCYCNMLNENDEELSAEAQKEMSLAQYRVFHATGHTLHAEAILAFLQSNNSRMWSEIFKLEPQNGLIDDKIKQLVASSQELNNAFKSLKH